MATENKKSAKKKSMTGRILAGIGLGVLVGLFFGEAVAWLGIVGDVFVGLLQMTVLPFVIVSLIANIGRFSFDEGRALAKVGSLVLLLLFSVALAALVVLPFSFPPLEVGAFFSTGLLETREPPDFFELYIPSNPFHSLSSNLVPATVLFSILLGVALTGMEGKKKVLPLLDVALEALGRVNGFVVRLTPIGVFAIAGAAAGTMTVSEFGRLQAYLVTHTFGVLLLTFLVVPALISILTPLSFGRILRSSRDFLLTAWATGSLFAVLPMLIESIERLLEDEDWAGGGSHATPGVLVPLGYPFPTIGKLLALVFVPFVAWFLGSPLDIERYPVFLSAGLFSSFGSLVVTIPFMLQLMELPSDFFNLFLMAGVWSARLGDLAGGMHLLAFTVLTMAGLSGKLRLQVQRVLPMAILVAAVTSGLVLGTRWTLASTFPGKYAKTEAMENLHAMQGESATVLDAAAPNPIPLEPDQNRLDRSRQRGAIRVGFQTDRLPFSFFNHNDDLVGFDIDLARQLATDLNLDLELVPYEAGTLPEHFAADHFDLAVGGLWGTLGLAGEVLFSDPYIEAHAGLLVLDHRRRELDSVAELKAMGTELDVAAATGAFMMGGLATFPQANLSELGSESEFFGDDRFDGLITTVEGGSAWTLTYPEYEIVMPIQPAPVVPLVIAVAGGDQDLRRYLDLWIQFHRTHDTIDSYFEHWIQGGALAERQPRWSIGRDVLGLW